MANFSNSSDTKRTTKTYIFFFFPKAPIKVKGFWPDSETKKKPAMHYSTWFNVISDEAEVAESFKDVCVLKGFLGRSLLGEKGKKRKANSPRCVSVSEQSEWVKGSGAGVGMNNAGQGPIVWRNARCSPGRSTGDFVKYWFATLKLLCECCPACWAPAGVFFYFLHRILRTHSQRVK